MLKWFSPVLMIAVQACVYAPDEIRLTEGVGPASGYVDIVAVLPDPAAEGLPPAALDGLRDGVPVRLDLTLEPPLVPHAITPDGLFDGSGPCEFGTVPATSVSLPTGSYHMLLDVRLGSPGTHPANLLSCDYDPDFLTDEDAGSTWRLRGCFLPRSVSIPTAVLWVLNPLPASACGIGD